MQIQHDISGLVLWPWILCCLRQTIASVPYRSNDYRLNFQLENSVQLLTFLLPWNFNSLFRFFDERI